MFSVVYRCTWSLSSKLIQLFMPFVITKLFLYFFVCVSLQFVSSTVRHYGSYTPYGSGDTMVLTFHNHGGPRTPHRKWIVECLDGEALVGVQDFQDDFGRLQAIWCRFVFSYKPSAMGLYPYYPSCVVRNYTTQFFCFDRRNSTMSINTFMTAVWDDEYQWFTWRPGADDTVGMKCCKVPKGYFIDYVSCYYMSTHDEFGEYYDSLIQFMVYCSPGYVATGMSRKIDASKQNYIIDWIQCCRLGHGAPTVVSPPRAEIDGGYPSYIARENYIPYPIPQDYQAQYRSVQNQMRAESPSNNGSPTTVNFQEPLRRSWRWKATDLVDRHPLDKEYALPSM